MTNSSWKTQSIIRLMLCVLALNAGGAQGQEPMPPNRNDPLEVVDFRDRTLHEAMRVLSLQTGLNIVPSEEAAKVKINFYMANGKPEAILKALEKSYGFLIEDQKDTIYIHSKEERKSDEKAREMKRNEEQSTQNAAAKERLKADLAAKSKIEELRSQETKLYAQTQAVLKKIVVKGRILSNTETSAVLLDVEGRLVRIAKQGMLAVGGSTFRVEEITDTEVRIVDTQRNQVLVVN